MMKKTVIILSALLLGVTAHAADEMNVREIPMGADKAAIHAVLGQPDNEILGYRERYSLTNGNTAVLQYYEENSTLESGYILVN